MRTHSGYWKEKDEFFMIHSFITIHSIAIYSEGGGEGSSSASSSPSYQGVRRTLEFYEHNGTMTDWVIHKYNLLDNDMFV